MNILDAYALAARLHAGQLDKAGRPYIEHLSRVFLRTMQAGGDREQQIAALLHDAFEDKRSTQELLLEVGVPQGAVKLVAVLSRTPREDYRAYLDRVKLEPRAALIKIADLEDNMDEERLALLSPEEAARLRAKYTSAVDLMRA